ncbi:Mitogen-activated protein kinase kinase 2 [Diplonema papillatum]|nr:Mitogen-activated protein kinase kinase 2 [Diplonema papillatum]
MEPLFLDVSMGEIEPEVPNVNEGLGEDDVDDFGMVLGSGAGGKVTLCKNRKTGEILAKKTVVLLDDNKMKEVMREVSALRKHDCQHLVRFYGVYFSRQEHSTNFLLEYMDVGSLQDVTRANEQFNCSMDTSILALIMRQAVAGLKYIHHTLKMIHRDLKPGNLLLSSDGAVKVSDFGISRDLGDSSTNYAETYVGTLLFMAPEMTRVSRRYTNKIDIWALGISAIELATGEHPFRSSGEGTFLEHFQRMQNYQLELPASVRPEVRNFIEGCVQQDPEARMDCAKLLSTAWLKDTEVEHQTPEFHMKYLSWIQEVKGMIKAAQGESHQPSWTDGMAELDDM